jgi:hypothetical protein
MWVACLVAQETAMTTDTTLLELVCTVALTANTDDEIVARVVFLVNSGAVRLCGNFRGARFDPNLVDPKHVTG